VPTNVNSMYVADGRTIIDEHPRNPPVQPLTVTVRSHETVPSGSDGGGHEHRSILAEEATFREPAPIFG
jgi:hypothetical protein